MGLSEGVKQRLSIVIDLGKTIFHYGFIPTVLYLGNFNRFCILYNYLIIFLLFLGFTKGADPGMPEISLPK